MTHLEGRFTAASGHDNYWQAWRPEPSVTPRALVLLVHGLHEHSGRYAWVAERLVGAGYAVYAVDHEGHGRSGGTRGNIGSMDGVLADLDQLLEIARADLPGLPLVVLGHSLGGLIALDYVLDGRQGRLDGLVGLVLSGAAVDTSSVSGLELRLAPVLARLAPNLGVTTLGAANVSRDPEVVRDYENDPLNHQGKVRALTGSQTLTAVSRVVDRLPRLSVPVLVLHGSEDKLVPAQGSRLIDERAGSADKTLRIYDGLYHEIFNEPERDEVLDDVLAWLDAHVAGGPDA